ncbi:snaclec B9-like [Protopterus annectens]|uniref:snaclec B9-like n=1 Tax=Protopterus annectens TaxID=7888 RepID=UPI001CFA54DD|nr:snaclec B9-like [Protopterus annectens]
MASYITLLLASFSWMVMTRFLIFGSLHTTENIDNGCPCNWKTFQNHCYKVFLENKSWDDANEHCKFHGSHLAVINSKAENVCFLAYYYQTFNKIENVCDF